MLLLNTIHTLLVFIMLTRTIICKFQFLYRLKSGYKGKLSSICTNNLAEPLERIMFDKFNQIWSLEIIKCLFLRYRNSWLTFRFGIAADAEGECDVLSDCQTQVSVGSTEEHCRLASCRTTHHLNADAGVSVTVSVGRAARVQSRL